MKHAMKIALALSLALLMLLCAACGAAPAGGSSSEGAAPAGESSSGGTAPAKEESTAAQPAARTDGVKLSQDAIDLVGTWVVVGGEGTGYSGGNVINSWNDGDRITFFIWRGEGSETLCVNDGKGFVRYELAPVTKLENGVIVSDRLAEILEEEDRYYLSFSYKLEDAPECHAIIWEETFAKWTDFDGKTPDLLKPLYQKDTKDRMILHVTGYQLEGHDDEEQQVPIDTTLTLEKILPLFFVDYDNVNLSGKWVDSEGRAWEFLIDDYSYLHGAKVTDKDGEIYTDDTMLTYHEISGDKVKITSTLYLYPEDESKEEIIIKIADMSFDGRQIVFTLEDGSSLVLTPAA